MENYLKIKQLERTFPKLTEIHQQYVLGITEGLKHAQENLTKSQIKGGETGLGKLKD